MPLLFFSKQINSDLHTYSAIIIFQIVGSVKISTYAKLVKPKPESAKSCHLINLAAHS